MSLRAVLFDLDGTLVDTTELILASCAHTFERHLGRSLTREAIVATFGRSLPEVLLEVATECGLADPTAAAEEMLATYRAHNDAKHDTLIRPFGGVEDMLAGLRSRRFSLAVVTSKREGAARRGLQRYGLQRFFDVTVFHDDTERHKPDPEPLLVAAARIGARPADAAYVGDSVHDIVAGRAAGLRTVAALWGPFDRAALEAAGPDAMAPAPADVLEALKLA